MHEKTFIIAEAGVNHNGSVVLAKDLVSAAVNAGADAVKFQTFNSRLLATQYAPKAAYQNKQFAEKETHLEMLSKLELSKDMHLELKDACERLGIIFLSSAFDLPSLNFLNDIGLPMFKVPSGEITDIPYLRLLASFGKPVILSTGMSTLIEITCAISTLKNAGLCGDCLTLLHCNSAYPTPFHDVKSRAINEMRELYGVPVGYSDHTQGTEIAIAAVTMGATIIEKHLTVDRALPGPDQKTSLEPKEFGKMVAAIRNIEAAMTGVGKEVTQSELSNRAVSRKSIVASCPINVGDVFTINNITTKRPGYGIPSSEWDNVIGSVSRYKFETDDLIKT